MAHGQAPLLVGPALAALARTLAAPGQPPRAAAAGCPLAHAGFASMAPHPRRRSASRIGESDGNINRKRIKALRLELQKRGWKSLGY